jgi:hypothetical protein
MYYGFQKMLWSLEQLFSLISLPKFEFLPEEFPCELYILVLQGHEAFVAFAAFRNTLEME